MRIDPTRFVVGDEWAYRLRHDSPSQRVRILAVIPKKTSVRLDVAFLDDPDQRVENVSQARLRVPWGDVASFDVVMANWQRIDDVALDDTEQASIEQIFQLLISDDVAQLVWSPVSCATEIRDPARLTQLVGMPVEEILAGAEWFDRDGMIVLSPRGTLLVAEAACAANPMAVLDLVVEQETEARHRCKNGGRERLNGYTREKERTTPEWEYDQYRRYDRPRHELLRQWCGHRAITIQERLLAAEAENQRLDVLVTDVIKALQRAGDDHMARYYAEEHERDRITPHNARPIVDRPLHPSEIPVREVHVRRRWGY